MKIIHTSDWHIGKIVNEYSMIDDQKYILNKLIELIDEENIDVLMIAGDVYDRSIPPVEAVELLNETLSKLIIDKIFEFGEVITSVILLFKIYSLTLSILFFLYMI